MAEFWPLPGTVSQRSWPRPGRARGDRLHHREAAAAMPHPRASWAGDEFNRTEWAVAIHNPPGERKSGIPHSVEIPRAG